MLRVSTTSKESTMEEKKEIIDNIERIREVAVVRLVTTRRSHIQK